MSSGHPMNGATLIFVLLSVALMVDMVTGNEVGRFAQSVRGRVRALVRYVGRKP